MTPGVRVSAAIVILDIVLKGEPVNKVLLNWFRKNRFAGSKDRFAIREIVFNCLRFKRSSLWAFTHHGFSESGRSLVLGSLDRNDGVELDFFDNARFSPTRVTRAEKVVLQSMERLLQKAPESVVFNYPDFLDCFLNDSLGVAKRAILNSLNNRAQLFLRVNLLKSSVSKAIACLKNEGVAVEKSSNISNCLLVKKPIRNLEKLPVFSSGKVEIQDISSQAIVNFINPRKGISILDYCAGSGGKTLAMASLTNMQSKFFIHDKFVSRTVNFKNRAKRAGVYAKVVTSSELEGGFHVFDLVVADVPCSGTGVWRRSPESKWWLTKLKLDKLRKEQREIVLCAANLVRQHGYLAYITCSILKAENQDQINWFLSKNKSFLFVKELFVSPQDGGDGFYTAILKKATD